LSRIEDRAPEGDREKDWDGEFVAEGGENIASREGWHVEEKRKGAEKMRRMRSEREEDRGGTKKVTERRTTVGRGRGLVEGREREEQRETRGRR
jgi:hypothetical protein